MKEEFTSRQFIKNFGTSGVLFVLQFGIGFILTPILIDAFGLSSFGIIRLATSTTFYIGIISKSFSGAVDRFFVIELQKKNEKDANKVLNTALIINFVFFLITLPFLVLVSFNAERIFSIPAEDVSASHFLFLAVQLNFFINIFTSPFYAPSSALNRVDVKNAVEIVNRSLNLIFSIFVAKYFSSSIGNIGLIYIVLGIINFSLMAYFGYRFAPFLKIGIGYFDKEKAKKLLHMSLWLLFDAIGTIIFLNSDIIFANMIYGAEVGGKFGAVLVTVTLTRSIGNMFSKSVSPLIYRAYSLNQFDYIQKIVRISTRTISIFMGLIVGLLGAYAKNLLHLWLGKDYIDLWWLVFFLQIPWCFTVAMAPIYIMRTAHNRIKIPTIILIVAGALNILFIFFAGKVLSLGFFVIPLFGSLFFNLRHVMELIYLWRVKIIDELKLIISIFYGIITIGIGYFIGSIVNTIFYGSSWMYFFLSGFTSFFINLILVWYIILKKSERAFFLQNVLKRS